MAVTTSNSLLAKVSSNHDGGKCFLNNFGTGEGKRSSPGII